MPGELYYGQQGTANKKFDPKASKAYCEGVQANAAGLLRTQNPHGISSNFQTNAAAKAWDTGWESYPAASIGLLDLAVCGYPGLVSPDKKLILIQNIVGWTVEAGDFTESVANDITTLTAVTDSVAAYPDQILVFGGQTISMSLVLKSPLSTGTREMRIVSQGDTLLATHDVTLNTEFEVNTVDWKNVIVPSGLFVEFHLELLAADVIDTSIFFVGRG